MMPPSKKAKPEKRDMDSLASTFFARSEIIAIQEQHRFLEAHTALLNADLEVLLSMQLREERILLPWKKGKVDLDPI
jgi:hypothetical protein